MCNKSLTITAEVQIPDSDANGMTVTDGSLEGGYGLYLRDGKPAFVSHGRRILTVGAEARAALAGFPYSQKQTASSSVGRSARCVGARP